MKSKNSHTRPISRKPVAPANELVDLPMPWWMQLLFGWIEAKGKEVPCDDCQTR